MKKSTFVTFYGLLIAVCLMFFSLSACTKTDKPIVETDVEQNPPPTPEPEPGPLEGFVISSTSGDMLHGGTMIINGVGFGTKATAAPLVWDDASGPEDLRDIWTDAWPKGTPNTADRNFNRRVPHRGIDPPHNRVGRYLSGCHNLAGEPYNAYRGPNVTVWKQFPANLPMDIYASCWMRLDPNWEYAPDDNYKMFSWSMVNGPTGGQHLNYEYNRRPKPGVKPAWHLYSSEGQNTLIADGVPYNSNGYQFWAGDSAMNTIESGWVKYEIINRFTDSDGFIQIYEDGKLVCDYHGHTDSNPSLTRLFAFGMFARPANNNPDNWRYFTDLYLDIGFQRVIMGDQPTLVACTKRELQIPTAWADNSITVKINRGIFSDTEEVYLFVIDENNTASPGYLLESGT